MPEKVATYFTKEELACKCCGFYNFEKEMLDKLDFIRDKMGVPIRINSGCRCIENNKKVGGADNSLHIATPEIIASAVDILSPRLDYESFYKLLEPYAYLFNGLGFYPGEHIIHIDNRKDYVRWTRIDGDYYYLLV